MRVANLKATCWPMHFRAYTDMAVGSKEHEGSKPLRLQPQTDPPAAGRTRAGREVPAATGGQVAWKADTIRPAPLTQRTHPEPK